MKASKTQIKLLFVILLAISQPLAAVPTFQTYIEGAEAGNYGPDEQTWLIRTNPFNLVVVGAYQAQNGRSKSATESLTEVTLLVSVPQGQTGTISISGGDVGAALLTTKTLVADGYYNPNADADIALLTDMMGDTGYTDKS